MTLDARIKHIRLKLNKTQADMANALGIANSTYQYYERGERVVPGDVLVKISTSFGVNPDWLLMGRGDTFGTYRGVIMDKKTSSHDDFIYVPLFDEVRAAAGNGNIVYDETCDRVLSFRHDWISKLNITPNKLSALHVSGDSMEPTLKSGDILLVDHSQIRPEEGRIFVIRTDDGIVVKRSGGLDGQHLLLLSDNPVIQRRVIDLSKQDCSVVGRVVWFGRAI